MRVTAYWGNKHWCRVHKAGCRDIGKEERADGIGSGLSTFDADSVRQVVEEVAGDFLGEDERTWSDWLSDVSLAPCINLPSQQEFDKLFDP